MGTIRKQGIQTTIITYIGFAIGAINMVLFARLMDPALFGLTRLLISIGLLYLAFSSLGSITLINKFYPYYRDHLAPDKRDLFGIVILLCITGFIIVSGITLGLKSPITEYYRSTNGGALFSDYYYIIYPYSFFFIIFSILEVFSYNQYKSVLPIFLKEVFVRLLTTLLIILFFLYFLNTTGFIVSYSLVYAAASFVLIWYLIRLGLFKFSFKISNLTKRLSDKLIGFTSLIYGGNVFTVVSQNVDTIVISYLRDLKTTGIFEFNTYISNIIMIPQKSIVAISIPVLAQAWKDKDLAKIHRIYSRSSLVLLTYAILIFGVIWLNLENVFQVLKIPDAYLEGKSLVLMLGLMRIMDLGTGVSSQIIGTSNHWKFEFGTNLILVSLAIPLNYFMIYHFGMLGSGIAQLFSLTVFNAIRFTFLYKRYKLQPFSMKTVYTILVGLGAYYIAYFIPLGNAFAAIVIKSITFAGIFIGCNLLFKLSEDVEESYKKGINILQKILKRK